MIVDQITLGVTLGSIYGLVKVVENLTSKRRNGSGNSAVMTKMEEIESRRHQEALAGAINGLNTSVQLQTTMLKRVCDEVHSNTKKIDAVGEAVKSHYR